MAGLLDTDKYAAGLLSSYLYKNTNNGLNVWDLAAQRANDPLYPKLSSTMMQQDLVNKGLNIAGMAPIGMAKYFHGGVPYENVYKPDHNPRDMMGYLGSWWTPTKDLADSFGKYGSFAARGDKTGSTVTADLKGKYLEMDDPFWLKHGFRDNKNAIDNEFDVIESMMLGPSMARLSNIPVMKWIDMPSQDRMKIARDNLKAKGYSGLRLRDAQIDRGQPQTVVFGVEDIIK